MNDRDNLDFIKQLRSLDAENRRLDLERQRLQGDLELRQKELQVRQEEVRRKKLEFTPLTAGVITAVIGLCGTALGALLQGRNNQVVEESKAGASIRLEREKTKAAIKQSRQAFELKLVEKALTESNHKAAADRLKFYIKMGYVEDLEHKKLEQTKNPYSLPLMRLPKVVPSRIVRSQVDRVIIHDSPAPRIADAEFAIQSSVQTKVKPDYPNIAPVPESLPLQNFAPPQRIGPLDPVQTSADYHEVTVVRGTNITVVTVPQQ